MKQTLLVDLGLTLVQTRTGAQPQAGWVQVDPALTVFATMLQVRPSARPFLEAARTRGWRIVTLSSSDLETQEAYLAAAGLRDLVDELQDAVRPIRVSGPWVLVDDDDVPESKLELLGIRRLGTNAAVFEQLAASHHVQCSKFSEYVDAKDAEPLTGLFEEIEEKLTQQ